MTIPVVVSKGRSYVVFGGPGVGKQWCICCCPASMAANGFKLDGENNDDYSGYSVSAAGDINGDGYADLMIGAYWYPGVVLKAAAMWCLAARGWARVVICCCPVSMAPMALNSMAKIMMITAAIPSAPPETSMAMGMLIW